MGPKPTDSSGARLRLILTARQTDMGMLTGMHEISSTTRRRTARPIAAAFAFGLMLAGCAGGFGETFQRGYVLADGALEQIPVGSSQEQVLIVLGTPSTVATVSGEVFYYISQRTERSVSFMPEKVVDQRVIAVYFDKTRKVERLANYGLKDGRVFDYISRTTPSGGEELSYLTYVFKVIPVF